MGNLSLKYTKIDILYIQQNFPLYSISIAWLKMTWLEDMLNQEGSETNWKMYLLIYL